MDYNLRRMPKIGKKIITIVLALIVFAGTLYFESAIETSAVPVLEQTVIAAANENGATIVKENTPEQLVDEARFMPGDELHTASEQSVTVSFEDRGLIRLGPLSQLVFTAQTEDGYVFELRQGRAWVNNLFTTAGLNVKAGASLVLPRHAAFDVSFDGTESIVRAMTSHITVGLVGENYSAEKVYAMRDSVFVNSFLVAQGGQATVPISKVERSAGTLEQLLYSKLIKEFQYGLISEDALAEDSWLQRNLDADRAFVTEIEADKLEQVTRRNLVYTSLDALGFQIDSAIDRMADVLTFTDSKKQDRLLGTLKEQFLDAEYLLTFGRVSEAEERLKLYRELVLEQVTRLGEDFKKVAMDELRRLYADLRFVLPTDSLYEAKVAISDMLISLLPHDSAGVVEKLGLIRDYMDYAFILADRDLLLARLSLQQYFDRYRAFLDDEGATVLQMVYLIAEENQIMDNLLRQHAEFYQDGFFAMKRTLENEWLKLLPEGNDKNEERQTIISTKIDFLKRLQTFFLAGNLDLDNARVVATRLITEIKDLQPDATVGVSSLFELRLENYGEFLTFLNTTTVSELRGVSPQGKYDDFLDEQRELGAVDEVIRDFLGEEPAGPGFTVQDLKNQVITDFGEIGIVDLEFGTIIDTEQRNIPVENVVFNDVRFNALYDWQRQQISQIESGETMIQADPVRLNVLPGILKPLYTEEITEPPSVIEPPVVEQPVEPEEISQAERVARILLIQKLKESGLEVKDADIQVPDLQAGLFVVGNAVLVSNDKVQAAFAYDNKQDQATSIIIRTPAGDFQLNDTLTLAEMGPTLQLAFEQTTAE